MLVFRVDSRHGNGAFASSFLPTAVRVRSVLLSSHVYRHHPPGGQNVEAHSARCADFCYNQLYLLLCASAEYAEQGWVIIICGVVSSAVGAALFPLRGEEAEP